MFCSNFPDLLAHEICLFDGACGSFCSNPGRHWFIASSIKKKKKKRKDPEPAWKESESSGEGPATK